MDATSQRILSTFDQLERESLDLHTLFEFAGGNQPEAHEAVLDAIAALVKQKLLREDVRSDFYRRTEDGRLALAGPLDITLYTREGCKLCEEAKAAILPLLAEFGAKLSEVDIDDDPVLHGRYTNDVPVVFLGARKVAEHRVDPVRLRRQLEQARH